MSSSPLYRLHIFGIVVFHYITINQYWIVCPTVTCDFEIDPCSWQLDSTWKVKPSGTSPDTASSGPIADHTTGNGNYARFMANLLSGSDKFGFMNSSTSVAQSTYLSFWYFMHGSQIGTLTMTINDQAVWEKSGRQGIPNWYQANVTIPAGENITISFVANRTSIGRSSDIAIDDIVLQDEPMPLSTRTTSKSPSTTPRSRVNASCDFDVDTELCGWKSDSKYGWKVIHKREPNITIGPSSDYSSITRANSDAKKCTIPYNENGLQYYCIERSRSVQCKDNGNKWIDCRNGSFVQIRSGEIDEVGDRSEFDSPVLDAMSEEGCVQFQYNIAGTDNDWLHVYVEDYWTNEKSCMWHKNGSTTPNRWITAEAPLRVERDGKYQIVFEARKGAAGGMGVVSIDQIIISSTKCSGTYLVEECPLEDTTTSTSTTTTTETSTTSVTTTVVLTTTTTTATTTTTTTTTATMTTTTTATTTTTTATTTTTTTTSATSTITSTSTITTLPSSTSSTSLFASPSSSSSASSSTSLSSESVTTTINTSTIEPSSTSTSADISKTTQPTAPTETTPIISSFPTSSTTQSPNTIATDIEGQDSTTPKSPSKNPSVAGIVIGILSAVAIIIALVVIYLKQKELYNNLYAYYVRLRQRISPKSSNKDSSESIKLTNTTAGKYQLEDDGFTNNNEDEV